MLNFSHQPQTSHKMATPKRENVINENKPLKAYYDSIESRLGYRFFLGGARHFGYWENDTRWPFPLGPALRRMEDRLAQTIDLPAGSRCLDAGCGNGRVATHLARAHGLKIQAIDFHPRHVARAQQNIRKAGLDESVSVQRADYHHLEAFEDGSFDGVYTIEAFVHATDPKAVLEGFFRVLRPGGHLGLHEYAHVDDKKDMDRDFALVNKYAAMPANVGFGIDTLPEILKEVGFEDVRVIDIAPNILPILRLFYVIAYVPYLIARTFRLERYFINAVAAVVAYKHFDLHRYYAIQARKPQSESQGEEQSEQQK